MVRILLIVLFTLFSAQLANTQTVSPDDLTRRSIERRAVEAVIWGMPAVNAELMFQAMKRRQGGLQPDRLLVAAARLEEPDAHAQPRHDLPHALLQHQGRRADGAGDSAGAMKRLDHRQHRRWLADGAGRRGPAGVDKGKGGKYLILPPGYKDKVPDGYIALPSQTYAGFALLRSNLKSGSDADIAKAVAYGKRVQILSAVAGGKSARRRSSSMRSTSCSTAPSPTTCASSRRSIASCSASRGSSATRSMIDQLKTIGIEKGKPFNPDAKTKEILERRRARSACLARSQIRGRLLAAVQ